MSRDPSRSHGQKLASLAAGSLILSLLDRFALFWQNMARNGLFGRFFTGYRKKDPAGSSSLFLRELSFGKVGQVTRRVRLSVSRMIESSFLLSLPVKGAAALRLVSLRFFGTVLFFYALCIGGGSVLSSLLFGNGIHPFSPILWGAAGTLLVSLPCLFSRKTVGEAILCSYLLSAFLFRLLGLRQAAFRVRDERPIGKTPVAVGLGIGIGLIGLFTSPLLPPLVFFGIIGIYALLCSPETGIVLLFASVPFLPTMPLAIFTVFLCFSYAMKLLRSKRTLKIEPIDFFIALFGILILFGGIVSVSRDSLRPSLLFCCFLTGYFLTVNLLRTREWASRAVFSIILACAGASTIGLWQQFTGRTSAVWQDTSMFSDIGGRIVSTFENPNVFGEYLILSIPLIFAALLCERGKSKGGSVAFLAVSIGALLFTWSRGAWLGLCVGMLFFLLLWSRRTVPVLLFASLGIPFLPYILPASVLNRLGSIGNLADSSTAYRVYIWRAASRMFSDHALTGIGIGEGAFSIIYPNYSFAGIESAPHSHNLYLQIGIELGLPTLLLFLFIIVLLVRSALTLSVSESKKSRAYSLAALSGLIGVMTQGLTDYVWYNYRIFFFFWLTAGLVSAMAKNDVHKPEFLSGEFIR